MCEYEQTIVNFQRWEVCLRAGKNALEAGKYEEAEKQLKTALDQASKMKSGDPRVANISCALAELYYTQKQFEKAEQYYKQVIEIWESTLGPDYQGLIVVYESYSMILANLGRNEESRALMDKVDQIKANQDEFREL